MIKRFSDFFNNETPNESQQDRTLSEQNPCPIKDKEYCDYYLGYDATLKVDEDVDGAYVFEFPSVDIMKKFLEDVGGMPHPHGGARAVLTYKDEEIPEAFNHENDVPKKSVIVFDDKDGLYKNKPAKISIDYRKNVGGSFTVGIVVDNKTSIASVQILPNGSINVTTPKSFTLLPEK